MPESDGPIATPAQHRITHPAALTALLALAYFAALVSRNPDVLFRPQFSAEVGSLFYQQAHALRLLHTLSIPYAGYLLVFPRLVAAVSLLFPLSCAPLVFNFAALLAQCLPAIYLCSPRMQNVGPLKLRILLAFLYIGVPNVAKIHGNLTNAQWHLAVLSLLIPIAIPPASRLAVVFDVTALSISALTGPYSFLLLPVAILVALSRRESWTIKQIWILAAAAIIQATVLLRSGRPHTQEGLGASVPAFCRIVAFQVFVPVFRGMNNSARFTGHPLALTIVSFVVVALGVALMTYAFVRGGLEIRCLILFAALLLAASLASPLATASGPEWAALQNPGSTHRYWYIPELAVAGVTVWLSTMATRKFLRALGAALVCVMLVVDVIYWRLPSLPDMHFGAYAANFKALPPGAHMQIPINPPGWFVELTKTPRD